jgi:hypothetical protein
MPSAGVPSASFHAFWAINGSLDRARLRDQLARFRVAGFDGVVFHPRFYPGRSAYLSDEYLRAVSETVLHAKSLGLSFWIYDENGWPSGTVGGEMLMNHPELRQRWAGLYRERPERCIVEFEHDGCRWYVGECFGPGVDYLNPALAPHFLALTHERYRTGLQPEAFAHVEAFFCDEPEFGLGHAHEALPSDGAIPWTPDLAKLYAERHGEDLLAQIRDLFFTTARSAEVRVHFWTLLRDRFSREFLTPLDLWCQKHGKRFTAHIKGEEHPLFQVPMVGSGSAVFRHVALPGIDALGRRSGNDFFPRQVVSSARQFGDGRCMAEAFGGAGWGATPEDLERHLLWLGGHGITDFVLHLSQYRLDSAAIRDWPPSQPFHLTWTEAYPEVLRRVRAKLATAPPLPADTLVVSPHRAIMAAYEPRELPGTNIHDAATYPDSPAASINRKFLAGIAALQATGAAWHVTDEATFEGYARREQSGIKLGGGRYHRVLAAEGVELDASCGKLPDLPASIPPSPVAPAAATSSFRLRVDWMLVSTPVNSLLIETTAQVDDWFFGVLPSLPADSGAALLFADDVERVELAGAGLPLEPVADGTRALLPRKGTGPFRFRCVPGVRAPFVWLQGRFLVLRETPDAAAQFCLARMALGAVSPDLIAAGFPFLRKPLTVRTAFTLAQAAGRLQLDGIAGDAARVRLDGADAGWIWGSDWSVYHPLSVGEHTLELQLVPNGYNHYGPHHHYLGDRHVVSPDQFSGKKNFADPADAPACTLTADWHFMPFRLPEVLQFYPPEPHENQFPPLRLAQSAGRHPLFR